MHIYIYTYKYDNRWLVCSKCKPLRVQAAQNQQVLCGSLGNQKWVSLSQVHIGHRWKITLLTRLPVCTSSYSRFLRWTNRPIINHYFERYSLLVDVQKSHRWWLPSCGQALQLKIPYEWTWETILVENQVSMFDYEMVNPIISHSHAITLVVSNIILWVSN